MKEERRIAMRCDDRATWPIRYLRIRKLTVVMITLSISYSTVANISLTHPRKALRILYASLRGTITFVIFVIIDPIARLHSFRKFIIDTSCIMIACEFVLITKLKTNL